MTPLQEGGGGYGGIGTGGGHGGLREKIGLAAQFLKTKLSDQGSSYGNPAVATPSAGYGGGYGGHGGVGFGSRFAGPIQAAFAGYKPPRSRRHDASVLISACEPQESSADANPTGDPRHAYGALSNAIQTIIGESREPLTNGRLVMAARKLLTQQGYKQHPCLYCNDQNAEALFLGRP